MRRYFLIVLQWRHRGGAGPRPSWPRRPLVTPRTNSPVACQVVQISSASVSHGEPQCPSAWADTIAKDTCGLSSRCLGSLGMNYMILSNLVISACLGRTRSRDRILPPASDQNNICSRRVVANLLLHWRHLTYLEKNKEMGVSIIQWLLHAKGFLISID